MKKNLLAILIVFPFSLAAAVVYDITQKYYPGTWWPIWVLGYFAALASQWAKGENTNDNT